MTHHFVAFGAIVEKEGKILELYRKCMFNNVKKAHGKVWKVSRKTMFAEKAVFESCEA